MSLLNPDQVITPAVDNPNKCEYTTHAVHSKFYFQKPLLSLTLWLCHTGTESSSQVNLSYLIYQLFNPITRSSPLTHAFLSYFRKLQYTFSSTGEEKQQLTTAPGSFSWDWDPVIGLVRGNLCSVFLQKPGSHQLFSHSWLQGRTPQSKEVLILLQSTLEEQPSWQSLVKSSHTGVSPLKSFTLELKKKKINKPAQKFAGLGFPRQCVTKTKDTKPNTVTQKRRHKICCKAVFCWDIKVPCSTTCKHKWTSVIRYCTLLLSTGQAFHAVSPGTQEATQKNLDGSERNSTYQNFFMDQCSIKGLEIRSLQRSRGKLYGLAHSYAITTLQSLISGWGKVGEKWVANFSMPQVSFKLKGTLFRICLLFIEKKAFCTNSSDFL